MAPYKSLFSYLCLFYCLLFACILSFYFFNPFSNKCIQGNCNNGNGVYAFQSGMRYDGEWKNGKKNGQGTLTYPDGSKYTGAWENDRMHGQGIKIYTSAQLLRRYTGEWKKGNKHGKGTAIYLNGSRYEGHWKDGELHGKGTRTIIDGRKITGEWKNGELFGTVTEIYPDGKTLVVELKNSKKNGRGTMTYPDGTTITGQWINNKLVGSLKFYLFSGFEFEKNYDKRILCNAIIADISPSLNARENSLAWLNELLKNPNLYEEYIKKIPAKGFSQEISTLIERTKDLRNRNFFELSISNQKDIVKLNRLLIEHLYPTETPKVNSYGN